MYTQKRIRTRIHAQEIRATTQSKWVADVALMSEKGLAVHVIPTTVFSSLSLSLSLSLALSLSLSLSLSSPPPFYTHTQAHTHTRCTLFLKLIQARVLPPATCQQRGDPTSLGQRALVIAMA